MVKQLDIISNNNKKHLFTPSEMYTRSIEILYSTNYFNRVEGKILLELITGGSMNGKQISLNTGIPDSKVYPALVKLFKMGIVNKSTSRPMKYYVKNIELVIKNIIEREQQRIDEFKSSLSELEDYLIQLWEPAQHKTAVSYFVKEDGVQSELINLIRASNKELKIILSPQFIHIISINNLIKIILHVIHRVKIYLAVPKNIILQLRGSKLKSNLIGEPFSIDLTNNQQLKIDNSIKNGKLILCESIISGNSYIIRDSDMVCQLFHHPLQSFAIVSSESDFINIINSCWEPNNQCVVNFHN